MEKIKIKDNAHYKASPSEDYKELIRERQTDKIAHLNSIQKQISNLIYEMDKLTNEIANNDNIINGMPFQGKGTIFQQGEELYDSHGNKVKEIIE